MDSVAAVEMNVVDVANFMQSLPGADYLGVGLLVSAALAALATLVAIVNRALLVVERALNVYDRLLAIRDRKRT